jgi:Enoyl-(Acyl carrier protein) reductase
MSIPVINAQLLRGRKGLIVGIANDRSIAWGCARAFRAFGAELAITYLNEKAKPYVEPLVRELEAPIFMRWTWPFPTRSRRCSTASPAPGASSISSSTPSPSRPGTRSAVVSSTCRARVF